MRLSGTMRLLAVLDRTLNTLYLLCGAVAAGAIVLIAVLVAASIVSRLAGIYLGGLTEGAGYAMAAAGSFGLAYTFGAGAHVRVDLVLSKMPGTARALLELLALAVTAAAITWLAWYLTRMVVISWQFGDLSDGSDALPLWLPQLPAAFGFCVFAIALCHGLIRYCFTGQAPWLAAKPGLLDDQPGD